MAISSVSEHPGLGRVLQIMSQTGTGAGTAYRPTTRHATFDIDISGTATCVLQVSWDGTTYRTLTSQTATASVSISEWYSYIRANVTSGTGTVVVKVAEYYGA